MKRTLNAPRGAALVAILALAGCGASSSPPAAVTRVPSVLLTSTAITGVQIPARYTCDGKNVAPPLQWSAVPPGTTELALFVLHVTPNQQTLTSIEWAMAGVSANLHSISTGAIPHGAFLERASDRQRHYSVCPPKGQTQYYRFVLYAVPPTVRVTPKITAVELLANLTEGPEQLRADASGGFTVTYKRK